MSERTPIEEMAEKLDRRIRLTSATDIEPLPIRWAWEPRRGEGRIPTGEITLTPGYAGVGKSSFHAWLIAHLTRGVLPGACDGTPRPALIAAREDSWQRTIIPRLIAAGADLSLVYRVDVETSETVKQLTLPTDLEAFEAKIVDLDAGLVSLDPLISTIEEELDSYKTREIRDALEPLQQMADRTGTVILGNAHFNKSSGSDPLLKIAGAAGFGEVARAVVAFARDKETGGYAMSQIKNNLGRTDLPHLSYRLAPALVDTGEGPTEVGRFEFVGETARGVAEILNPQRDTDSEGREIARRVILDSLADGPESWETMKTAIEKEGVSERTGRRARDELKKGGLIGLEGGGGDPWKWSRKGLVGQPRVGSGQVANYLSSPLANKVLVGHDVAKGNVNGDAYLSKMATEEETLRANVVREAGHPPHDPTICPECGLGDGLHAYVCSHPTLAATSEVTA